MRPLKIFLYVVLGLGLAGFANWYVTTQVGYNDTLSYQQLEDSDAIAQAVAARHFVRNSVYFNTILVYLILGVLMFANDLVVALKRLTLPLLIVSTLFTSGCAKPFEPVVLKDITTSEEGFLIPLRGDKSKQVSTNSEEDLRKNLVTAKQVQIPQQWVQKGYEWFFYDGEWKDAAILIKVNRAPVTREWTADTASGTSTRNEAIWVMTSDQVEFSTGWTCTARIATKDDAIKFLHNYPNGELQNVMDSEIRAKIQSTFGLEVTDLPMDQLRKAATPHIKSTTETVTAFFKERGISITNLGITGGFVYKDKSVLDTLVKVFNAEQEKNIAAAATAAQNEKNKKIKMEAEGKAAALLLEKKAEAEGIRSVAEAKAFEIEKAQSNKEIYLALKSLEVQQSLVKIWDGKLPTYFSGEVPKTLLNVPAFKQESK